MQILEFKKYQCPKCGKDYEDAVRAHFTGKPCKQCTQLCFKISTLQRQLLAKDFSIEKEDAVIIKQINDLLIKEIQGNPENNATQLTKALTERLIQDEKRRKEILDQILELQKEK